MATREEQEKRIRAAIARIAEKPRSVLFSEIEWVIAHLRDDLGYEVRITGGNKHFTFTVGDLPPFQVCDHHRGQRQLKIGYVTVFLARMSELGLLSE